MKIFLNQNNDPIVSFDLSKYFYIIFASTVFQLSLPKKSTF